MNSVMSLLSALLLTLAAEEFVVVAIFKKETLWLQVLAANLLTSPALNLILTQVYAKSVFFTGVRYWSLELIALAFVICIEGVVYARYSDAGGRSAIVTSLFANMASYALGKFIF